MKTKLFAKTKTSTSLTALSLLGGLGLAVSLATAAPGSGGRPGSDGMGTPPERGHPVLRIFDADQDGQLSAAEISQASAVLLTCDADHNGALSMDELIDLLPPPPRHGEMNDGMGPHRRQG